jgi:hypothetical protein
LVAIARDHVSQRTLGKETGAYIHKFRPNAIVIRDRPDVHREFVRLLAKLEARWHSSSGVPHLHMHTIPVVGENEKAPNPMGMGGMFAVKDR